ncbi:hypothetical protein ACFWGG_35975, partial [Streptomyces roseolus]
GEWQAGAHGEDPIGKGSLWEAWNTVQRREFLNFWIDHIEVGPATTGKLKDIGDRLTIHWARIEPESDEEDDDQNAAAETGKVLTFT